MKKIISMRLTEEDNNNLDIIKYYLENNLPFCFLYDNPGNTDLIKFAIKFTVKYIKENM